MIAAVWGGDAAYWATPARAAEILIGGVLALAVTGRSLPRRWSLAAPLALVALAAAVVTFPSSAARPTPAPCRSSPSAAVPCCSGCRSRDPCGPRCRSAPFVWLGRISYGVYLYHWPVYVIVDERRTDIDGAPLVILRLAITLAIAQASYMLVELPIRRGRSVRLPITFATAAGATAAVAIVGFAVLPASAADYWSGSAADVEAASIRPSGEPLAPVLAEPTTHELSIGRSDLDQHDRCGPGVARHHCGRHDPRGHCTGRRSAGRYRADNSPAAPRADPSGADHRRR